MSLLNHAKTDSVVTLLQLVEQLGRALIVAVRGEICDWKNEQDTHLSYKWNNNRQVVVFEGGVG
jgi:hypothetical protein